MAGAGTGITCATATAHTDGVQRDLREIYVRALVGNAPPVVGGRHVSLRLRDSQGTALGVVKVPLDAQDSCAERGCAVTSWPLIMSLTALANLGEDETVDARLLSKKQRQRHFGVLDQFNKVAQIEPAKAGFASELAAVLQTTNSWCSSAGEDAIRTSRRIAAGEVCTFARVPMCPCPCPCPCSRCLPSHLLSSGLGLTQHLLTIAVTSSGLRPLSHQCPSDPPCTCCVLSDARLAVVSCVRQCHRRFCFLLCSTGPSVDSGSTVDAEVNSYLKAIADDLERVITFMHSRLPTMGPQWGFNFGASLRCAKLDPPPMAEI